MGEDKSEENTNPVVEVNAAFSFSEPVEYDAKAEEKQDTSDIPKVPDVKVAASSDNASDSGKQSTGRRTKGSAAHRARQAEYQRRIAAAKQAAPITAAALHAYLKVRGVLFDTNDPNKLVPYWFIDTAKGEEIVSGTIAEALTFHGLAGASGFTARVLELIESHPGIVGMLYIAGMMTYIEIIIQAELARREREEREKIKAENVAVQDA